MNGVVLDAYTAWTIATMGIFDVISAVFPTITIPQSALDELNILSFETPTDQKPQMTIAWHNGEFVRQELSPESVEARKKFIDNVIVEVRKNCRVEPVSAPDQRTEIESTLTDTFDAHVLGPVDKLFHP